MNTEGRSRRILASWTASLRVVRNGIRLVVSSARLVEATSSEFYARVCRPATLSIVASSTTVGLALAGPGVGCSDGAAPAAVSGAQSGVADAGAGQNTPPAMPLLDANMVVGIEASPLQLVPAFSPSISDYYVRCASGTNSVTLTVTDATGAHANALNLAEDQVVSVADQYWIRCLPHDFPTVTVTTYPDMGAATPGWYLVNSGPFAVALDTNGTPVWYSRATMPGNIDALSPQTISLMPNMEGPFGYLADNEFTVRALTSSTMATVMAVKTPTDGHEFRMLPNGDALVWTYPLEGGVDLSGLQAFGTGETIADCQIQEISPSGSLVWSWLASDHVDPVRESVEPAAETVDGTALVDVFHFNSIDVDSFGNLLLSARHTNALFYVDRGTGKVLWKLGGTPYNKDGAACISVVDDPQGAFNMQHDARFLPNGDVTLFDDHGAMPGGVARGVEYAIDFEEGSASVAFQFLGTGQSKYEGSFRRFPDGESVVGWGYVPNDPRVVTEINAAGQPVLEIAFSGGQPSYRAVKVPLSQLDARLLRTAATR